MFFLFLCKPLCLITTIPSKHGARYEKNVKTQHDLVLFLLLKPNLIFFLIFISVFPPGPTSTSFADSSFCCDVVSTCNTDV